MSAGKWYLRLWDRRAGEGRYNFKEYIVTAHEMLDLIRHHDKMDAVCLTTGKVARHDYKKPLPQWLNEPLAREIRAAAK